MIKLPALHNSITDFHPNTNEFNPWFRIRPFTMGVDGDRVYDKLSVGYRCKERIQLYYNYVLIADELRNEFPSIELQTKLRLLT